MLVVEAQRVSFKSFQNSLLRHSRMVSTPANGGKIDLLQSKKLLQPLDGGYFSNQLTFFCRAESRLEKATGVPLKFRLGSLAYTDYLERKPNAVKP